MLYNLLSGGLGVLAMIFITMKLLQNEFTNANVEFSVKKFFAKEWINIVISVIGVLFLAISQKELLSWKPWLGDYIRTVFALVGLLGPFSLIYFFGKSKKYITNIIDIKTNVADEKDKKNGDEGGGGED